jgi:hypothetical protein
MKTRKLLSKSIVYGIKLVVDGKELWFRNNHGQVDFTSLVDLRTVYMEQDDARWFKGYITRHPSFCEEVPVTKQDVLRSKIVRILRKRYKRQY